jgi:hypothetical protein
MANFTHSNANAKNAKPQTKSARGRMRFVGLDICVGRFEAAEFGW